MPKNVIEIAPMEPTAPAFVQQLRVVAYCRVSTRHEEQQSSLEYQINCYTNYIKSRPSWTLAAIYFDAASGLSKKKRVGYQQLIRDCDQGKVDLILVKSLSRFGRDALETIEQVRRLKEMDIGIYVEGSGFSTLAADDLLVAQLAAVDQEESRTRSENIKFGIRHRMRSGKAILNHTQFLGYTKGQDGRLVVVPEEAKSVRKIFELYIQGKGVRKIKKYLETHGIKTVTGKTEWSTSTIDRILSNEKYMGQVLMQKTYTPDFLTGQQVKNQGQLEMYLVEGAHEAIIDRETFDKVQAMKGHIKEAERKTPIGVSLFYNLNDECE